MFGQFIRFFKKVFALKGISKKDIALSSLGTVCIVFFARILHSFYFTSDYGIEPQGGIIEISNILSNSSHPLFLYTVFLVCIYAPIIEELIFRGGLWSLLRLFFSKTYVIFISSFIFAIAHGDLGHMIGVFPIAIWLGFLRARSGSILAPIIGHLVNNSIITCFIALG